MHGNSALRDLSLYFSLPVFNDENNGCARRLPLGLRAMRNRRVVRPANETLAPNHRYSRSVGVVVWHGLLQKARPASDTGESTRRRDSVVAASGDLGRNAASASTTGAKARTGAAGTAQTKTGPTSQEEGHHDRASSDDGAKQCAEQRIACYSCPARQ